MHREKNAVAHREIKILKDKNACHLRTTFFSKTGEKICLSVDHGHEVPSKVGPKMKLGWIISPPPVHVVGKR